jgi:hypothetical protein
VHLENHQVRAQDSSRPLEQPDKNILLNTLHASNSRCSTEEDIVHIANHQVRAQTSSRTLDVLWTVGSFSRFVAEEAIANGMPEEKIRSCETAEEVSSFVTSQLKRDDTVLIKGSRGMKLESVVRQIESHFSRKKENNSALLSLV